MRKCGFKRVNKVQMSSFCAINPWLRVKLLWVPDTRGQGAGELAELMERTKMLLLSANLELLC